MDDVAGFFVAGVEGDGDDEAAEGVFAQADDGLVGVEHHGFVDGVGGEDYVAVVAVEVFVEAAHVVKAHFVVDGEDGSGKRGAGDFDGVDFHRGLEGCL